MLSVVNVFLKVSHFTDIRKTASEIINSAHYLVRRQAQGLPVGVTRRQAFCLYMISLRRHRRHSVHFFGLIIAGPL